MDPESESDSEKYGIDGQEVAAGGMFTLDGATVNGYTTGNVDFAGGGTIIFSADVEINDIWPVNGEPGTYENKDKTIRFTHVTPNNSLFLDSNYGAVSLPEHQYDLYDYYEDDESRGRSTERSD